MILTSLVWEAVCCHHTPKLLQLVSRVAVSRRTRIPWQGIKKNPPKNFSKLQGVCVVEVLLLVTRKCKSLPRGGLDADKGMRGIFCPGLGLFGVVGQEQLPGSPIQG